MTEPTHDPDQNLTRALTRLAQDTAPRLFAIATYDTDTENDTIAAWGLAFPDHAYAVATDSTFQIHTDTPQGALRHFDDGDTAPRLVWLPDNTATPTR